MVSLTDVVTYHASLNNIPARNELRTMVDITNDFFVQTVTVYFAHQVRAFAQFLKINADISKFTYTYVFYGLIINRKPFH